MKKIIFIIVLLISIIPVINAQTRTVAKGTGEFYMDAPSGTYIKDINNTFTPYLGTWKYQNGNEILTIKLEKVTKHYYPESGNYKDFIKGNYSYTINNGSTYITNTIATNQFLNESLLNSFYASGPDSEHLDTRFTDQVKQKNGDAIFTFLPGSTTQLSFKINDIFRGYIFPEVPPTPGFSIPTNVVLTKQ